MRKKYWMQEAFPENTKGALHRQLGIPQGQDIPKSLLRGINNAGIGGTFDGYHKISSKLWHRAHAAVNAQKRKK